MLNIKIFDGWGSKNKVLVNKHGAMCVSPAPPTLPPVGASSHRQYFSSLLGSTGADTGTTNMNEDGSVNSTSYKIVSNLNYDLHLMAVVIVIADSAVVHNSFGNVSALTNGWDLSMFEGGVETKLVDAAKTGGQVIAQTGFGHSFGDGAASWELTNWTGTADAQGVVIPLHSYIPDGIRIGRGTQDRIVSTVKDDLTGLTEFTVRIIGYRQYP